jgi:hypothetical protein
MKNIKIVYAIALLTLGLAACKKDDPAPNPDGINSPAGNTIQIAYNGTLDLSTLFSIEPAGATGTLSYSITQPSQQENGGDWETLDIYSLSGSDNDVLGSNIYAREPDTVYYSDNRRRKVDQGRLKVSVSGTNIEKIFTIVQTSKPAIVPTAITLVNPDQYEDGPNGKLRVVKTSGVARGFSATAFDVAPIDFDPNKIFVLPQPGNTYIKAPDASNPATSAGGRDGQTGEGEYVIAFYCEGTSQNEIQAAYQQAVAGTVPSAKLYVNVEAVVPTDVVGIEVNTEDIGKVRLASFWRTSVNGRQSALSFIKVKLNNGDAEPYNGSIHGAITVLAGEFDQYMQGYQPDAQYPDWFSNVNLKAADPLPPIGTEVSFTVTVKAHHLEDGWTVRITTNTLDPENLPW